MASTTTTTTVTTDNSTSSSTHKTTISDLLHIPTSTAIAIFVVVLVVLVGLVLLYAFLYKKGWISCATCKNYVRIRKRTLSISSTGPLADNDPTFVVGLPKPGQDRELFSIGDGDGVEDGRPDARRRSRRGTEDEFFYDEIFEHSAFVDETTNRANKQLTVKDDDFERMLDELEVPDLEFKRPTSRI
ncbi:uncharacterized protein LOC128220527 [Mya arenaria]|uniref:uncharacterized protein LOC128220527 n=1 Tax=Mya arenaria TaxID=6604 RepID=UPI0022DF1298|nr:uncharacterized protein LOC128220527 [Mya arenaria]